MRIVSEARLKTLLGARPGLPRVVAGGSFATPWRALAILDDAVADATSDSGSSRLRRSAHINRGVRATPAGFREWAPSDRPG